MPKLTNRKVEGTYKINLSTVPQGQLALKPKKKGPSISKSTIYANNMKLTSI